MTHSNEAVGLRHLDESSRTARH